VREEKGAGADAVALVRARGSGELLPPNPCPPRTVDERPSPPGRVVEVLGYSFE
jgi:hypothetical protein